MRLSVVVTVYGVREYAAECLNSIGTDDVEVIRIDDGRGVSIARNAGLEMATGDWIMFVDGDDVLAPDWQEAVRGMIRRHPEVDMVGFGVTAKLPLSPCSVSDEREVDVSRLLGTETVGCLMPQFAYRAQTIRGLRFPEDLVRGEDKVFLGHALLRARRVAVCDAVIYGYRQREGSAMHQPWNRRNLGDEIGWRVRWLTALADAGKTLDRAERRLMGLYLLEYIPHNIFGLEDPSARRALQTQWFDALNRIPWRDFAPWQHFAMRILAKTRSVLLARVICTLPFELKRRTMFMRRGRA